METYLTALRPWIWPMIVSFAVLAGFAIRGSDLPAAATGLCAVFAALSIVLYLPVVSEKPSLSQRSEVRRAALALCVFVVAIGLPVMAGLILGHPALYDPSAAILESLKLGGLVCAFFVGLRLSLSDDRARRLLDALLYAGGVWAIASIFMFILDPAGIYGEIKFGAGRLTGAFSSPNSAGTLFGALSVMALGRLISRFLTRRDTQILERIDPLMAAVFAASLAALMLTVSRGAFFATLIATIGLCLLLMRGRLPLSVLIGFAVAGLVGLALLFATPMAGILARLDALHSDAAVRTTILKSHFAFASHHPWFGSGLGAFNTVNAHIVGPADYPALSVIRAMHNVYLQWFEETGVIGLIALGGLNLAILIPMGLAAGRRSQMGARIWAILGGYAVFLLHGFTDYAFQEPALTLFVAVILGCGFGMAGNRTPEVRKPSGEGQA